MTSRSSVYSLLVPDPTDTLAALAFTQYEQHKVETYSHIEAATGQAPTPQEMGVFEYAATTPRGIAMYRRRAESMVNLFLDATLETRKARLEAEFMTTAVGRQLADILAHQRARKGHADRYQRHPHPASSQITADRHDTGMSRRISPQGSPCYLLHAGTADTLSRVSSRYRSAVPTIMANRPVPPTWQR